MSGIPAAGLLRKVGINLHQGNLEFSKPIIPEAGIAPFPGRGKVFFLDPTNGSDTNSGRSPRKAFKTLSVAYAALTADQNDLLAIIYHGDAVTLSAQFTWAKDGTHVIGIGGSKSPLYKGVPITMTDNTATGQFVITADRCTFTNLQFNHTPSSAAGIINVSVQGDNLTFVDCQFLNANNAASAGAAGYLGLNLDGCANASFYRCTIGGTVTERTASAADLTIGAGTITGLYMEDCLFIANLDATADASHAFIETVADADLGDFAYLVRPTFVNSGAHAGLPDALTIGASTAGFFLMRNPLIVYITDIADNEEKCFVEPDGHDTTAGKFIGVAINTDVT